MCEDAVAWDTAGQTLQPPVHKLLKQDETFSEVFVGEAHGL